MGTQTASPSLERRLAALAQRQYGVVGRGQLVALGLGSHGIAERVRSARLHRLHRGVYAVGHRALKPEAYWLAAVLACGAGAVLSHASAAAHWGLRPSAATVVDVTVPTQAGRAKRRGIRVHRCRRLAADEVTTHEGIPITTVARTLLDLADVLSPQPLKRAIDEAEHQRLLDYGALLAVVSSNPGRRGATRVLRLARAPTEMTRSDFERAFLGLVERYGLPRPRVGVWLHGYEADFLWPDQRLIVETDGFGAHGSRRAFHHDRLRDRRLARAGFQTIRLTTRDVVEGAEAVAADLEGLLTRRAG